MARTSDTGVNGRLDGVDFNTNASLSSLPSSSCDTNERRCGVEGADPPALLPAAAAAAFAIFSFIAPMLLCTCPMELLLKLGLSNSGLKRLLPVEAAAVEAALLAALDERANRPIAGDGVGASSDSTSSKELKPVAVDTNATGQPMERK